MKYDEKQLTMFVEIHDMYFLGHLFFSLLMPESARPNIIEQNLSSVGSICALKTVYGSTEKRLTLVLFYDKRGKFSRTTLYITERMKITFLSFEVP